MNVILLDETEICGHQAHLCCPRKVNHIRHVLKAQVGDVLKVGKIGAALGSARVAQIEASKIALEQIALNIPPPKKLALTVVLALPRPKVLRRLIMDMTAMGVAKIVLVNSYRTDKSYWSSPLLARLDEFVREGLEQGVDCVKPSITLAKRFKPFVQDELPNMIGVHNALVAHPYADIGFAEYIDAHGLPQLLIIGAEGGFIPYEIELLQEIGVRAASLGVRILRTEAAVNALLGRWLL